MAYFFFYKSTLDVGIRAEFSESTYEEVKGLKINIFLILPKSDQIIKVLLLEQKQNRAKIENVEKKSIKVEGRRKKFLWRVQVSADDEFFMSRSRQSIY